MIARYVAMTLAVVASLSGRVLDRTTGQGLAHVSVTASGAHATTDASGRYTLAGVKPGATAVVLQSDDVPAQRFMVTIGAGATHRDFRACSTTLDYDCGAPPVPAGGGAGAGRGREDRS